VKEKSQIEDMRAALRGDIERARARREADPWRAQEPEQQADPEPEPAVEEQEPLASEGQTPAGSLPVETAEEPIVVETIEEFVAVEALTPEASVPEEAVTESVMVEALDESTPEPASHQGTRSGFFSRLFRRG
jgi:hypothetical protein